MRRLVAGFLLFAVPFAAIAADAPIGREDGFMLIWNALHRAISDVREPQYKDIAADDVNARDIRFAKSRGILDDDVDTFRPKDSLDLQSAILWLFRSRNIDDPENITPQTLSGSLMKYPIAYVPNAEALKQTLSEDQLMSLMRSFDNDLSAEVHEVSLYSEKFNGHGTAFGETFDMNTMTAAHRTFPYNTLVKVMNVDNGKSVTVRINDRGPYVAGRDMDLSLGAFTTIADRSKGVIHATFERIGDATIIGPCVEQPTKQQRLTRTQILSPGVPHVLKLGSELSISSSKGFVVRSVLYPDGTMTRLENWVVSGEAYTFKPSVEGRYVFTIGSLDGHSRHMQMDVANCGQ
jgi:rare lipoprotein A